MLMTSILFLNDQGPSLKEALHIISEFYRFSGLKVNWEKSQLPPIDPTLPLMWADTIRYLGIVISLTPSDYCELNLVPLLGNMKTKLKGWANLPLSLVGRINLR